MKNEFKTITKRAKELLSQEESFEVEFKEQINGIDSSDIVAFANSNEGGSILIGVKETKQKNGIKIGKIIGCRVGDDEKLKILNKANSCLPPVDLKVYYENLNDIPFIRIEIPSGNQKPYCTKAGTYTIRNDNQKSALHPGLIFNMFLESEYETFANRFGQATGEIKSSLEEFKRNLFYSTSDIESNLDDVSSNLESSIDSITNSLDEIFQSAQNAEELADESMRFSDESNASIFEVERKVETIEEELFFANTCLESILNKLDIENPKNRSIRLPFQAAIKVCKSEGRDYKELIQKSKERYKGIKPTLFDEWAADC